MSVPLTVHNASIHTAAVEIKTLTISGKQVTLAVFRQLPRGDLINHDGSLNGIPWGTVNYHGAHCISDAPHWHVIWQSGDKLCRDEISKTFRDKPYTSKTADMALACRIRDEARGVQFQSNIFRSSYGEYSFEIIGMSILAYMPTGNLEDICKDLDMADVIKELQAEVEKERKRRAAYSKSVQQIGCLPQLFIAV